jgi:hypothetical protein
MLVACPRLVKAQSGQLFAGSDEAWSMKRGFQVYNGNNPPVTYYDNISYFIKGDTVSNNKFLQKIYRSLGNTIDTVCYQLTGYFYYDSNRVYTSPAGKPDSLTIAYDFNLQKGDTFSFKAKKAQGLWTLTDTIFKVTVDSVNYFFWGGKNHKWIRFKSFSTLTNRVIWEEGVGDLTYGLYGNDYRLPAYYMYLGGWAYLSCCEDNGFPVKGTCSYSGIPCGVGLSQIPAEDEIQIYPSPASNRVTIKSLRAVEQLSIYNAIGLCIKSYNEFEKQSELDVRSLANGVYLLLIKTPDGIYTRKIVIQH